MGRPKLYTTHAARQAAYRRRLHEDTILVNRRAFAQLQARLDQLRHAILDADRRGDPLAHQVKAGSVDTTLDKLITWFTQQRTDIHP